MLLFQAVPFLSLTHIDNRVPARATPAAVAETILSQVTDKHIGNVRLYQILQNAYERSQKTVDSEAYDDLLWDALKKAFSARLRDAKELVLVVDGVDEATCGEAVLTKRLKETTAQADKVKLIILGAQEPASSADQTVLQITPGLVFDDIAAVVRKVLEQSKSFTEMPNKQQEISVDRLTQAANGSFLWAKIAAKHAETEGASNASSLAKSIETLATAGPTLTDLVSHAVQSKSFSESGKKLLIWLATSARPLRPQELSELLSVQDPRTKQSDSTVEPLRALQPVNSLVFLRDNLVYLRHGLIRSAIVDVSSQNKLQPAMKDWNFNLAQRLLLYIRQNVTGKREPSLEPLDQSVATNLLETCPLLDFALRYWIDHIKKAFACSNNAEVSTAAKELQNIIPTCTTVPLLATKVWERKSTPTLLSLHEIQSRLYWEILSKSHPTTVQAIISQVQFYRQFQDSMPSKAIQILYDAAKICRDVLSVHNLVTMQITTIFLDATASQITDTKTEIMIKRTEALRSLVECYKVHYGASSQVVISTRKQLAEHYMSIKEDHMAQEILASIQGTKTTDNNSNNNNNGLSNGSRPTDDSLLVHLHRQPKAPVQAGTILALNEQEEDGLLVSSGIDHLESLLTQAQKYTAEGNVQAAEQTYVEMWHITSKEYRLQRSTEWELRYVQAILAYSKFLQSRKKKDQAVSVLSGFWQEYEQTMTHHSEQVISHVVEMAHIMRSVGMSALAFSAFKQCAQYYESTGNVNSTVYNEMQQQIQSTSNEVMQSATSSSTLTESSLQEMVFSTSTSTAGVSQESFTATEKLLDLYLSQHRWRDATRTLKKILHSVWPALFASSSSDATLPAVQLDNCVVLAESLADCYYFRRKSVKEEDIRLRLYVAVRRDRPAGDGLLDRMTTALIRLYEGTFQTDKVIALHQEILGDRIKRYGAEHSTVIKKLWTLAELTHPRPISVDYYHRIVQALNKKPNAPCHPDAFEPLLVVATEQWNQGRYSDAVHSYQVLFHSLQNPTINSKLQNAVFVRDLFNRYMQCLRAVHAESHVLHDVAVQYCNSCKTMFGATASITVHAVMTLAGICQESKQYEAEAIRLYEELLQIKSDDIDQGDIRAILDGIYEEQTAMAIASNNITSLSSEQMTQVVSLRMRRLETLRRNHGWAHKESLSQMEELVSLYAKRHETHAVVSLLKEATLQVLQTETSSLRLTEAAHSIASSYITHGQIRRARELAQEIYRQVVAKDTANVESAGFDTVSKQRESLVFLAQFEYSLREDLSLTLNEIFSSLMTEYSYLEKFRNEIDSSSSSRPSSVQTVTFSAARLHGLLLTRGRLAIAARVVQQLTHYFISMEGRRVPGLNQTQVQGFVTTLLDYFSKHESHDFFRSVAIAGYNRTCQLLAAQQYQAACDLALVCFQYIQSHDGYNSLKTLKLAFQLGLAISGRDLSPRPADDATRKKMLSVSSTIMQTVLEQFKSQKVDLTQLDLNSLNSLIGLLDEQQDYGFLAWVLTTLWNRRENNSKFSQPQYILALGRMLVVTRYLVGDHSAALRLAEDIVYNCNHVHGAWHPITVEMTVLLSQMYASFAQSHQSLKDGREMARRYYKKAAGLHESALRAFVDPSSDLSDAGTETGERSPSPRETVTLENPAKYVRQHFHLLKLAVERLGDWPRDFSEYQRLSSEVFNAYGDALKGMDGVDKWNLKRYGSGRAEASDDLIRPGFRMSAIETHAVAV